MLVAKVIDGLVLDIQDYRAMFPNTSFPTSGPNADFFVENSLLPVSMWKPHNLDTEQLVNCPPYIEGGVVYNVMVALKPEVPDAP